MNYIIDRHTLTCTIFVPFACGNNCDFCNTNNIYKDYQYSEEYLNKILNWIEICNQNPIIDSYILTGGEPFFNLNILKVIIDKINKPVYINTTLPLLTNINEIINYININKKIQGINISRQFDNIYNVQICDISYLEKIHKPIKINTIITENDLVDKKIDDFINIYYNLVNQINFRADYMKLNNKDLKTIDNISTFLFNKYKYIRTGSCLICCTQFFYYTNSCTISYHRGLKYSSMTFGDRCYVNDLIIDMYGNIYKDWDFIEDNEFNTWLIEQINS